MLKVRSLSVAFGGIKALNNVSISVSKGELVALIGSNGAGKTTLLSSIMGLNHINEGEILLENKSIINLQTHKIATLGMTLVPERRHIFSNMTVLENLIVGSYANKNGAKLLDNVLDIFKSLTKLLKTQAGMLSGGEQQMLAIGRALMMNPKVILMDEPSMGLSPLIVRDVYEKLNLLKQTGLTIFLVEQNAKSSLKYADKVYVLEHGKVIISGAPDEIINDNEVKRAYLGKDYKDKWER